MHGDNTALPCLPERYFSIAPPHPMDSYSEDLKYNHRSVFYFIRDGKGKVRAGSGSGTVFLTYVHLQYCGLF